MTRAGLPPQGSAKGVQVGHGLPAQFCLSAMADCHYWDYRDCPPPRPLTNVCITHHPFAVLI